MSSQRVQSQRAQAGVLGKGQHDKLRMSGLFLPTFDSDAVLDGLTLGAVMKAAGEEPLWRSMRSMQSDLDAGLLTRPTSKLTRRVQALWEEMPQSAVKDTALEALTGEWWKAPIPADIGGQWGLLKSMAAGDVPGRWTCRLDHYVEVEAECKEATLQLLAGQFRAAADLAASSPVMSQYMNPTALNMLAYASDEERSLDPRFAGFIEFTLSHVARVDVATLTTDLADARDDVSGLINPVADTQVEPGRALVQSCIRLLEVSTQAALLRLDARPAPVDESTLKRWGLGQTFPTRQSLTEFLDAVVAGRQGTSVTDRGQTILRRRLDRLQWSAQRLHVLMRLIRQPGLWAYVFHERRPDDWVRQRYAFWLNHWRAQGLVAYDHHLVPSAAT